MAEQQPGWELALFGATLHDGLAAADAAYQSYLRGDRDDGPTLSPADINTAQRMMNDVGGIVAHVATILTPDRMTAAMGEEGRSGDAAAITALATDLTGAFNELLGWARQSRALRVPQPYTRVYTAVSHMADAPMRAFHDFATTCAASSAAIAADLAAGRTPTHSLSLALQLTIDDDVMAEFHAAMDELSASVRPRGFLARLLGR
jgi:hypothetical protein